MSQSDVIERLNNAIENSSTARELIYNVLSEYESPTLTHFVLLPYIVERWSILEERDFKQFEEFLRIALNTTYKGDEGSIDLVLYEGSNFYFFIASLLEINRDEVIEAFKKMDSMNLEGLTPPRGPFVFLGVAPKDKYFNNYGEKGAVFAMLLFLLGAKVAVFTEVPKKVPRKASDLISSYLLAPNPFELSNTLVTLTSVAAVNLIEQIDAFGLTIKNLEEQGVQFFLGLTGLYSLLMEIADYNDYYPFAKGMVLQASSFYAEIGDRLASQGKGNGESEKGAQENGR